ncbi:hypothetical protein B0I35DRAFT_415506 [Stachybotrys elegans]|uniref:Uncharacterized protein n=1 Tax=Stachybotrys elegans TaxID=80388 RepID=A0A8K0S7K3_9HYPO|nr:hypothetical protein B0I35DRAFT_415506 [Stachybotrys elegans]
MSFTESLVKSATFLTYEESEKSMFSLYPEEPFEEEDLYPVGLFKEEDVSYEWRLDISEEGAILYYFVRGGQKSYQVGLFIFSLAILHPQVSYLILLSEIMYPLYCTDWSKSSAEICATLEGGSHQAQAYIT